MTRPRPVSLVLFVVAALGLTLLAVGILKGLEGQANSADFRVRDGFMLWAPLRPVIPAGQHHVFAWGISLFTIGDDREKMCEAAAAEIPGAVCLPVTLDERQKDVVSILLQTNPLRFPVRYPGVKRR